MQTIVISAVNIRKGGTLTILKQCLGYLSSVAIEKKWRIVALVHKKELCEYPNIEYIEIPWTIKSWWLRLWCEYVTMHKISKQLTPIYLWFSLHDTTPNVVAERCAVYCHNPFPFYEWKWRELFLNYKIVLFAWFSKYIYRINIYHNHKILVQQQWIRERFRQMFGLPQDKIIVTKPSDLPIIPESTLYDKQSSVYKFIFPSFSDIHKNFELLCKATELLEQEIGEGKFKVLLTIGKEDNKYTRWLYKKWGNVRSLDFGGFMSRDKLYAAYNEANCLVFPSKVETWGLPISEFTQFGKPMLLAELPYAHETSKGSRKTAFFSTRTALELKKQMKRLVEGDESFLKPVPNIKIEEPTSNSWAELFDILTQ